MVKYENTTVHAKYNYARHTNDIFDSHVILLMTYRTLIWTWPTPYINI